MSNDGQREAALGGMTSPPGSGQANPESTTPRVPCIYSGMTNSQAVIFFPDTISRVSFAIIPRQRAAGEESDISRLK